jgi:hypothetical protein
MHWQQWGGKRKSRPRQHVIAEMGVNFLERLVLRRGHQLQRVPGPEYGTDALMLHFSPETREIENGWIEFQVKATDELKILERGKSVACTVDLAHVHYWYWEVGHPFILVLYDASRHRAYWVHIQDYVDNHRIDDCQTLTVHIPVRNKLTVSAIDRFRNMSLTLSNWRTPGG